MFQLMVCGTVCIHVAAVIEERGVNQPASPSCDFSTG